MADADWTPKPYVSGAERPRGEGSIFDPNLTPARTDGPRAFVTGWPVWHSRSPAIHRSWLKEFGLAGSYERVGVPPDSEVGLDVDALDGGTDVMLEAALALLAESSLAAQSMQVFASQPPSSTAS